MDHKLMGSHFFVEYSVGKYQCSGDPVFEDGHRLAIPNRGRQDGSYVSWNWDGERLRVENDRFGFHPIYYFTGKSSIGVSTSLETLIGLGAPSDVNFDALNVFFRLGNFLASDTPFTAIRALAPNSCLVWERGQLRVEGGMETSPWKELSRSEAIDSYISLFREAIRWRSSEGAEVGVPLSGGRDSRHILLELCALGAKPKFCATTRYFPPGYVGDADVSIAIELCRAVGVPHFLVPQTRSRIEAERRCLRECQLAVRDGGWIMALADFLRGKVQAVFDGIGGDILSAGLFLTEARLQLYRRGRYEELALELMSSDLDTRMLVPDLRSYLSLDAAVARLVEELRAHANAANPIGSFYFWNRTRRAISAGPFEILEAACGRAYAPYLDHDLYDLLSGLPGEMFLDHSFHTDAIARAYPQFRHIPYAASRTNPESKQSGDLRAYATSVFLMALTEPRLAQLTSLTHIFPRLAWSIVRPMAGSASWLGSLLLYLAEVGRLIDARQGAKTFGVDAGRAV